MKNRCLKIFLSLLSVAFYGYADQATLGTVQPPCPKKETKFIQYHNRLIILAPSYQGYERIKPRAFYVGIEAVVDSVLNKGSDHVLFDTELRMGYNFFFQERDHLTPFAGLGYLEDYGFHHHHHIHHKPGIGYGTLGFLYNHEFNTIFNLGLDAKVLFGGPENKKHFNWGSFVVGTNVSIPFTFRFGSHRHWDYRIEPYNVYLHGTNKSADYVGLRSSFAYRF
jgi:hypothetical protein